MSAHTPGPWWLRYAGKGNPPHTWILEGGNGDGIAGRWLALFPELVKEAQPQQAADAHLMAAAPELLEALRQAKSSLVAFKLMPGPNNAWEDHDEANLKAVDEAIAKATGATP